MDEEASASQLRAAAGRALGIGHGYQPELWSLLDGLPEPSRPAFLRGDCNWGTERAMEGAEQRQMAYLFKLKQTANVKKLIDRLFGRNEWVEAGQPWQGLATELQLSGWTKTRRVVVLRRPLRQDEGEAEGARRKPNERPANSCSWICPKPRIWVCAMSTRCW